VSTNTLIRLVWGAGEPPSDSAVRVHVLKLRRLLDGLPYSISNVYGGSYALRKIG
jgi:DNA-binding response OmpR family regulator